MSTNKKKPSELTAWAGDKSMALHAHKPGVSQKVTIQDIINAVPVPEAPSDTGTAGAIETGAIVLLPESVYDDYIPADGAIRESTEAPELAEVLSGGVAKPVGYIPDSEYRYTPAHSSGYFLRDVSYLNGYALYTTPVAGNQVFMEDPDKNIVFSQSISSTQRSIATLNAMYTRTGSVVYLVRGVLEGAPEFVLTSIYSDSSYKGLVSVEPGKDLSFSSASSGFRLIDTVEGTVTTGSSASTMTFYGAEMAGGGRVFCLAKAGSGMTGIYEVVWHGSIESLEFVLVHEVIYANTSSVLVGGRGSDNLYFGDRGIQYCYNINTGSVTHVSMNIGTYSGTSTRIYAHNNVIWYNETDGNSDNTKISYDYGKTWESPPGFHANLTKVFVNDETMELVTIGREGSEGSVIGSVGSVQFNDLMYITSSQFRTPLANSQIEGYKQYVKK